jgi:P-type E1-E2 ATPase
LIFFILSFHLLVVSSSTSSTTYSWTDVLIRLTDNFTLSVALIIVAVPEGLPLAVGIALAFAVKSMRHEKVLIKNVNAPELMAQVKHICTGKTATLTANKMKVASFYANSRLVQNKRINSFVTCNYDDTFVELVRDCIINNCESRVEINDESKYEPVGNGTECGMI